MIIRVLGHGQWVMEPEQLLSLNEADEAVERAVKENDAEGLKTALATLLAGVRSYGTEVPDDVLVESDLVLPDEDATVEEVRALLDSTTEYYGLIPDSGNFEDEVDTVEATDVEPGARPQAAAGVSQGEAGTPAQAVDEVRPAEGVDGQVGQVSESDSIELITDAAPPGETIAEAPVIDRSDEHRS